MAIQNLVQRQGGNASALNLSIPTIVKSSAGTFWNINLSQVGQQIGYLYDWPSLVGLNPSQMIAVINPSVIGFVLDQPNLGPFPFFLGLVWVPGADGMIASISYS